MNDRARRALHLLVPLPLAALLAVPAAASSPGRSSATPTYNLRDHQWAGGGDPTGHRDVGPVLQAILNAIAVSATGNGTIVVPAGTYLWASGVITPPGARAFTLGGSAQASSIFKLTGGSFTPPPGSANYNVGNGTRAMLSLGDFTSWSSAPVSVSIHDLTFDETAQNLGRPNWFIALFTDVSMRTVIHSAFTNLTFKLGGTNVGAWLYGVGDTTPMKDITVRNITAYDGDGVFLLSPVISPTFEGSPTGAYAAGDFTIDSVTSYVTMNGITDDRVAVGFGSQATEQNVYALLDGVSITNQKVYVSPTVTSATVNPVKLETNDGGTGTGVVMRDVTVDGLTVSGSPALADGDVFTLVSYVDNAASYLENVTVNNVQATNAGRIFWQNGPHFANSTYAFSNVNLQNVTDPMAIDFWSPYLAAPGEQLTLSGVTLTSGYTGTRYVPFPLAIKLGNVAGGPGYAETSIQNLSTTGFLTGITSDYDEYGNLLDNLWGTVGVNTFTFTDDQDPIGLAQPVIESLGTTWLLNGIQNLHARHGRVLARTRGAHPRRHFADPRSVPLFPRRFSAVHRMR